jgi:hypothetical protein
MKDTSLKLFVDYPHSINQLYEQQVHRCWRNFLDNLEYKPHTNKEAELDHILDTKYNAAITNSGLRFKSESDLLMFVLRFS